MAQKTGGRKNTSANTKTTKKAAAQQKQRSQQRRSLWAQIAPYLMFVGAILLVICFVGGRGDDPGLVLGFIYRLLTGLLGVTAFSIPAFLAVAAILWIADKGNAVLGMRMGFAGAAVLFCAMLFEVISPSGAFDVPQLYIRGGNLLGGGVIGGLLGELFLLGFKTAGSYVLIIALLLLSVLLALGLTPKYVYLYAAGKLRERRQQRLEEAEAAEAEEAQRPRLFRDPEELQLPITEPAPPAPRRRRKFDTDVPLDEDPVPEPEPETPPEEPEEDTEKLIFDEVLDRTRQRQTDAEAAAEAEMFSEFVPPEEEDLAASLTLAEPDADEAGLLDRLADAYLGAGTGSDAPEEEFAGEGALHTERTTLSTAEKLPEPVPEYQFPPITLLSEDKNKKDGNIREELHENANKLVSVLASFNVKARIVGATRGPTVTRYELLPEAGTRVRSIENLAPDIALNLAATGVRIEAPIPGKAAVGIEVPNKSAEIVYLRTLLETEQFRQSASKITAALGEDVTGTPIVFDIKKMPHLLIAGATGMGKSVCINCLLVSLLYKAKPDEVKLILIDPKKVEFNLYNGLPHLLVPVVSDPKKAAGSLSWAVNEMERRYGLIEAVNAKDIASYNAKTKDDPNYEFLPQIVIVIDELADLMATASKDVETSISRIAAKARAAGMHLIIGTQRPSVDVITGVIKANIPSRIAFTTASMVDSKTIIDQGGAEALIGRGDMLYNPVGAKPTRVQGAFVDEKEVEDIVDYIKEHNKEGAAYSDDVMQQIEVAAAQCGDKKGGGAAAADGDDEGDPLVQQALAVAFESGKISTSLLQRRLSVGYGRAAKIIDRLEELGYVSAPEGQKPRELLITEQDYMERVMRNAE